MPAALIAARKRRRHRADIGHQTLAAARVTSLAGTAKGIAEWIARRKGRIFARRVVDRGYLLPSNDSVAKKSISSPGGGETFPATPKRIIFDIGANMASNSRRG